MDNNEEVYVKKLFFDISTISDAFPLSIVIKFMQLISFLLFVITFLDYSIKLFILDLIFNILFKNKFSAMKKPPATFYLSTHEKDWFWVTFVTDSGTWRSNKSIILDVPCDTNMDGLPKTTVSLSRSMWLWYVVEFKI